MKLSAQELRIGNTIKIKKPILKDLIDEGFQKIYTDRTTVIYVGYDYLGVIIDNSEVEIMLQDIEPIPLTEEWLLKFGFKKEHNTGTADEWYWKGGGISLTHELQLSSSDRHYESMPVDGSTSLKYVHQLQNLYFALTGEELAYRETV